MPSKTDLRYSFGGFGLAMCCAISLAGAGCFGPVPPRDPQPLAAGEPQIGQPGDLPEESFFDQEDDPPLEPPVLEPVRPIGEPIDGLTAESADLTDDGVIDDNDIATFVDLFGSSRDGEEANPAADFDGDGTVTLVDFQIFLELITEPSER